MAKQCYMKCQGMTWEGMKRCSSAGVSAAVQGWQDPLGTQALVQLYTGPQLSVGQTDAGKGEL